MAMRTLTPLKNSVGIKPKINLLSCCILFGIYSPGVSAGELKVSPSVTLDYYNVDVEGDLQGSTTGELVERSDQVIQLKPNLSIAYLSKKLSLSSLIEHSSTYHENSDVENNEFFKYQFTSQLELLPNSLYWSTNLNKSYRVADSQFGPFSDEIVGSGNLTGVTNQSTSLTYQMPNTRYIILNSIASYSKSKTNASADIDPSISNFSANSFNTSSSQLSLNITNGQNAQRFDWGIQMGVSQSDRSGELDEYSQANFSANIRVPITQRFSWVVNGRINKNEIDNDSDSVLFDDFSYREYGTGLSWNFERNSYISVLGYRSKSGEDETKDYIGGELNWIISTRSSLLLTANRNQFGENYNLEFSQNSRFVKTRASYSEGIDINSRQQYTSTNLGAFICPFDAGGFSDCFQPADPNYELQVGEQQIDLIRRGIELNDEVVHFSRGEFIIGYDNNRKLKTSISYSYTEQESLEKISLNNDRKTHSIGLISSYLLSSRSSINLNIDYSENTYLGYKTDENDTNTDDRVDKNTNISLFLSSDLSARLTGKVGLSRRERESNAVGFDIVDNRFNAQLAYRF